MPCKGKAPVHIINVCMAILHCVGVQVKVSSDTVSKKIVKTLVAL